MSIGSSGCLPPLGTDGKLVPDYMFRCSYCIKQIAEDSPVYMRQDHSYCSIMCRDKGLSRLYAQLRETQIEVSKQSSGSLPAFERVRSDSSLASRTTMRTGTDSLEGEKPGLLARFGQTVLDAMLKRVATRVWGAQVLRTYSSGVLWTREYMKENSSAQRLFHYLPEVDHYIRDSYENCLSSERLDSLAAVDCHSRPLISQC